MGEMLRRITEHEGEGERGRERERERERASSRRVERIKKRQILYSYFS